VKITVETTVIRAQPANTRNFAAATDERGVAMANNPGRASSINSRPKLHDAAMPAVIKIATDSTLPGGAEQAGQAQIGDHRHRLGCGRRVASKPDQLEEGRGQCRHANRHGPLPPTETRQLVGLSAAQTPVPRSSQPLLSPVDLE
jgi:hypothetical protein